MTIEQIIRKWVEESYGKAELDCPSWDIKALAQYIENFMNKGE